MSPSVGALVRHWREIRRMSQADLAQSAEVSARHLSCIERGRAKPSRQMVLVLASALDIPLRERNTLLQAAGFAAAYPQTDLGAPEMAQVRHALELMLHNHEPYGSVVMDRCWNILLANRPWHTMFSALASSPRALGSGEPVNLLEALFAPEMRPFVANWEEVAHATLLRLRREALVEGDEDLAALYRKLVSMPDLPERVLREDWTAPPPLVVPVVLSVPGARLSLFTTITTLGTPTDITLSELRIESYYPADAETERWIRATFGA